MAHCDIFTRTVAAVANKVIGIPVVGYVGDFASVCEESLGQDATTEFHPIADIPGATLKMREASVKQTNTFVGIECSTPARKNGAHLPFTPPAEKAEKWPTSIEIFLTACATEHARMGKLTGCVSFAQSAIFARLARSL